MTLRPKHQRLLFVILSVFMLCAAVLLSMQALRANMIYFYSPGDIKAAAPAYGEKIRIGGLVAEGSLKHRGKEVDFLVTDGNYSVRVNYQGSLPELFREGQGVIAEGIWKETSDQENNLSKNNSKENNSKDYNSAKITKPPLLGNVQAERILAKHDERYMPKEVVESLKRSGHWNSKDNQQPATSNQ